MNGKVVVVCGASDGMGRGSAEVLAESGATVILLDKSQDVVDTAESIKNKGFKCEAYMVDSLKKNELDEVFSAIYFKYGHIDSLVCAEMIAATQGFSESDDDQFRDFVFETNVTRNWNSAKSAIPYLLKEKSSSIVVIGSATGVFVVDKGTAAYASSKAALVGLTKALALEYATQNLRVNCICQGYIDIPHVQTMAKKMKPEDPQSVINEIAKGIPMGRLGTIHEIGKTVKFLVGDDSSYITGTTIIVDGGNGLPETNVISY